MAEDLSKIISLIPLDRWQREAVDAGVKNLSPEKSKEIAERLSSALAKLPELLASLESEIDRCLKDPQTLDQAIESAGMRLKSGKLREAQKICDDWINSSEGDVTKLKEILDIIQLRYRLKPEDIFSVGQPITRDKKYLFVGRKEEMKEAISLLEGGFSLLVTGEAGVGKTSFAWQLMELLSGVTETCDRWIYLPEVPHRCIWVDCRRLSKVTVEEILLKILLPTCEEYTFARYFSDFYKDEDHESTIYDISKSLRETADYESEKIYAQICRLFELAMECAILKFQIVVFIELNDELERDQQDKLLNLVIAHQETVKFVIVARSKLRSSLERSISLIHCFKKIKINRLEKIDIECFFLKVKDQFHQLIKFTPEAIAEIISESDKLPQTMHELGHQFTEEILSIQAYLDIPIRVALPQIQHTKTPTPTPEKALVKPDISHTKSKC